MIPTMIAVTAIAIALVTGGFGAVAAYHFIQLPSSPSRNFCLTAAVLVIDVCILVIIAVVAVALMDRAGWELFPTPS